MNVVRSVNELPDWFKTRKYEKQLAPADWYRSIRWRQKISSTWNESFFVGNKSFPVQEEKVKFFLEMLEMEWDRHSVLYELNQFNHPVQSLTKGEVLFLATLTDPSTRKFGKELESLIDAWNNEEHVSQGRLFPIGYELELCRVVAQADQLPQLNSPAFSEDIGIGNPYLSFGRPLTGHPLTVDLQYDDETILTHFKQWIKDQRRKQGVQVKKPISEGDFDDWVYYRVREIFDLELWSAISGIKILDQVLANALWPNAPDSMSPLDILRTTSRKKVKEIINYEFCARFHGQLVIEQGENFLL